jgi:hypothetical protein
MCRPYESAVHCPCTPHSVPLTLQVIVSDVYQQIVKQVAAERVAGAGRGTRPSLSRVITAGQPDQSQPRRRNSNTRSTPTTSISASTAG